MMRALHRTTNRQRSHRHTAWLVMVLALALGACSAPAPRTDRDAEVLPDAERHLEAGDYVAAAQAYERSAAQNQDSEALLRAAQAWYQAGRMGELRNLLQQLQFANLNSPQQARRDLLTAQLELFNNLPADALGSAPNAADLPAQQVPQLLNLRADALLAAGDPWASVQERLALDALLFDPLERNANLDQMFGAMQRMSLEEIDLRMRQTSADSELYGWLALSRVLKTRLYAGEPLDEALIAWRQRFPEHPAAGERVQRLISEYGSGLQVPDRIAVLLPLSGRFAAAGQAVRDGLLLAHFDAPVSLTQITLYDTAGTVQGSLTALQEALYDGADAIVGPLQKDSVAAVLAAAPPVTVLALNQPDTALTAQAQQTAAGQSGSADRAFIFALSPEDEAIRAAEMAISEGHRRALIMVPTDDWGRRVGDAFAIRFENLGGWVVGATQYNPAEQDYSGRIRPLLRLTDSELRHQSLERILSEDVNFEPRTRDDVDVIFAAARSEQGRQIQPQLRFHRAGGIPVFATSAIFAGNTNRGRDTDLNGVAFCDGPWILAMAPDEPLKRDQLSSAFPAMEGPAARLIALGIDSYRVLPFLGWLQQHPEDRFPGLTGDLWVDHGKAHGEVRRSLPCARFVRGMPAPLSSGIQSADANRPGS